MRSGFHLCLVRALRTHLESKVEAKTRSLICVDGFQGNFRLELQAQHTTPTKRRAGSLGKFEKKGHYEACGTVKLLLAAAQTVDVTYLEQAFLAEVRGHSALDWPDWLFRPCDSLCVQTLAGI